MWLLKGNPLVLENLLVYEPHFIDVNFIHCHCLRVNEQLLRIRGLLEVKVYHSRTNVVIPLPESKLIIILYLRDKSFSCLCLLFRKSDISFEELID